MWYDVLVVGVLLFAVFRGAVKGFVWQLATIAGLVLCFTFSGTLSSTIAPYIAVRPPLNRWLAMFGLYLVFSFLSFGIARVLRGWIEKAQFVEYDRHLGSVFGLIKGGVFVLVMTFFGVTLSHNYPEIRSSIFNSQTGRVSAVIMDRLHPVMPEEFHAVLEPYIHTLDRPGLNLKHAHDDQLGPVESDANNQAGPIAPPPFVASPRRIDDERPPFDSVAGGETQGSSRLGFPDVFDPSLPMPAAPERSPVSPAANGTLDDSASLSAARDKMLRQVAGVLKDAASEREAIVNQIEGSLAGLPDQIKNRVVQDWYTDFLVLDKSADPDPQTDLTTPFDARILRQLQLNQVPLSSLSTALQDRLRNARR